MNKPEKSIVWGNNGEIEVVVKHTDSLFIPVAGEKVEIGTYTQTTIQTITEVDKFKIFITEQEASLKEQIEKNDAELKTLENIDVALIEDKHLNVLDKDIPAIMKSLSEAKDLKDSKRVVSDIRKSLMKLPSLDNAIKNINKKKMALGTKKFLKEQLAELEADKKAIFNK